MTSRRSRFFAASIPLSVFLMVAAYGYEQHAGTTGKSWTLTTTAEMLKLAGYVLSLGSVALAFTGRRWWRPLAVVAGLASLLSWIDAGFYE